MRILALDTSTSLGSIAVAEGSSLLAERSTRRRFRLGEALVPLVESVLADAGWERDAPEALAVGIGPGSFTGTRVGVAFAKGLAIALDVPLVGVPSLEIVAAAAGPGDIAVVMDAQRGRVYAARYAVDADVEAVVAPSDVPPEEALRILAGAERIAGDGWRVHPSLTALGAPARSESAPRASVLAQSAQRRLLACGPSSRAGLEPLYVRPSDATLPRAPLRVPPKRPKT